MSSKEIVIAAFYRFVELDNYQEMRDDLKQFCIDNDLKGTILLAREGINSTISGTRENIDALFARFDADPRLANLERKESFAEFQPFLKMKVRLKQEIVRLGMPDMDISKRGEYIDAKDWDEFTSRDDVVMVDTRNHYEVMLGTFDGALNPATHEFRSFPNWAEKNLNDAKDKKIAMFCTGGIRCEKSTAYLKNIGFKDVYHLKGGILQYLEDTQNKNDAWQGQCFVFDDRVAVNEKLEPATDILCRTCGADANIDDISMHEIEIENNRGVQCLECRG